MSEVLQTNSETSTNSVRNDSKSTEKPLKLLLALGVAVVGVGLLMTIYPLQSLQVFYATYLKQRLWSYEVTPNGQTTNSTKSQEDS